MTPSHSNNVTATGQLDLSGLPNKKGQAINSAATVQSCRVCISVAWSQICYVNDIADVIF